MNENDRMSRQSRFFYFFFMFELDHEYLSLLKLLYCGPVQDIEEKKIIRLCNQFLNLESCMAWNKVHCFTVRPCIMIPNYIGTD